MHRAYYDLIKISCGIQELDTQDMSAKYPQYFGDWSTAEVKEEYQSTTHLTRQAGAQLSATFESM
jgi:hypothetical protein